MQVRFLPETLQKTSQPCSSRSLTDRAAPRILWPRKAQLG